MLKNFFIHSGNYKIDEYSLIAFYKLLLLLITSQNQCNFENILLNTMRYIMDPKNIAKINKKTMFYIYSMIDKVMEIQDYNKMILVVLNKE